MTPIKTGIIGFGRMASNHHLTAMRESGLYEVTAVCDITESRRQAAGKTRWDKKRRRRVVVRPGAVSRAMMMEWVRERGGELRGAGTDESPHCYKRISDVLAAHATTIEVLHTLRPLGVAMAAADEHDPYRD